MSDEHNNKLDGNLDLTMRTVVCVFGALLMLAGLACATVSAPRYGALLLGSLACETSAVICFLFCLRKSSGALRAILVGCVLIALLILADVLLRLTLKMRIMDFF